MKNKENLVKFSLKNIKGKAKLNYVKADQQKTFFPCTFTRKSGCFKENVFQLGTSVYFQLIIFR